MSRVDFLTKRFNRRALFEKLDYEIKKTERYGDPFCVLMIDIDHFKKVNDTYGHLVGDTVLVQVTETIAKILRKTDIFGRYGGEEFIVILPKIGKDAALGVAEKIRAKVENTVFTDGLNVTISIGMSEYRSGMSADALIGAADSLLYSAKSKGRNRVEC